ncbi:hypothetical protein A8O14_09725 [Polynucleobacter wuianus]|uniref:Serine aminopeptidase S33 domain-containing protein n=1 Tax=Polynucleobacter wuianus TaxID=1743168 RepID=A0A191UH74_9BURK|nr:MULTISPECIES: alpha/beta hydrolase [Polynucleobacter]ANJ00328.1 hypothetical protein A8O14_09725 [Polynucleobacter wuianus]MBU3553609.1 alpha/beta hydrolase [Polynucleobacter sp. MWH-Post4-6-1]
MKFNHIVAAIGMLVSSVAHSQVFDVPYKDDAPTRTLLTPVKNAKAVVLLFPGGGGVLKLQNDGSTTNGHTFVRSKDLWAQYGIDSVLVDTPYDLGAGMRNSRSIRDHQQRILNVVTYYKEKFNLPVWIFGHSMGTVSVTEFVNGGKEKENLIAGVIVAGTYRSATVDSDITVPVLAIHHIDDGCASTPLASSERIIESRPKKLSSQFIQIDGGISEGDVCGSRAYHGFNQKEQEFIKAAAQFILKN